MRPLTLIILDGFGIGEASQANPIFSAQPPTLTNLFEHYPSTALQASGIAVGLPWGEEGNSEVGHLTIGAGTVLFQHLPRITLAIRQGSFFSLEPLGRVGEFLSQTGGRLHLVGMLSSGSVHSSREHLEALLSWAEGTKLKQVLVHIITDGRDAAQREGVELLRELEVLLAKHGWRVATLAGRFYAMDKDGRWDRIEKVVRMIAEGKARESDTSSEVFADHYGRGLSDEFIEPTLLRSPDPANPSSITSGDAVLFWNFREDGMDELARAFADPSFTAFNRSIPDGVRFTFMTSYASTLSGEILFPPLSITNPLGRVLAEAGVRQLRVAEQEKSAHVTVFFNGLAREPFPGEYRIILPSPMTPRPDLHPEMNAAGLGLRLKEAEAEGIYDFILVNFANPDVVAHTGNFEATKRAIEAVDGVLADIFKVQDDRIRIITSDHGNAERVRHPVTGVPEPQHDPSPVPFLLVGKEFHSPRASGSLFVVREVGGILADVAPTILDLMGTAKPSSMTGKSLLPVLK